MVNQYIQTVRGKVEISKLKAVSSHEHLFTLTTPEVAKNPEMVLDGLDEIGVDIELYKKAGGDTVVEMTTVDYGRDLDKLKILAEDHDIHIIAAAGFNKGKFHRNFLENKDIDEVADQLTKELTVGVGKDMIKPGVIKIGTSLNTIDPWEEIGIRAISRAHLNTGTPISTHTEKGTMAHEQLDIFEEEGVNLNNVVLCHLDHVEDYNLHKSLIERGAFLSYDSVPKTKYGTEDRTIQYIGQLAKDDLHKKILIGGDFSRKSYYKGYNGKPGLDYILTTYKEKLKKYLDENELNSESIIKDIFINNPREAFSLKED